MNLYFKAIITFFRSAYFCFRYLPFRQAMKIPIKLDYNMKVEQMAAGRLVVHTTTIAPYMICLGCGGSPGLQKSRGCIILEKDSHLILHGPSTFSEGTVIRVEKGVTLSIGSNFYCNKNCYIRCGESVSIGNDCLFGWNITINDTDGHSLFKDAVKQTDKAPIVLCDHVWLTPFVKVTKGARIPTNCVVAQCAVVTEKQFEENCLLGGVPAKVINNNISWQR